MLFKQRESLVAALKRVTADLAELSKDERDEPSVGITGWSDIHRNVETARELLAQLNP